MPHHLIIPDTVEATVRLSANGRVQHIVMHFLIPGGGAVNASMADAIFAGLKSNWNTNLANQCTATVGLQGVDVRDLRTEGQPLVSSTTAAAVGTATGDNLPSSIAACLTVRTTRAGRKFRGRMYWGGFAESASGPTGQISTVTKTALDAFAANFLTSVNVNGLIFGVSHRPTAFDEITGLPISPGLGFTTPASAVLCRDTVWDSQRGRNQ